MAEPDKLAAELAAIGDRNERRIDILKLTEATVTGGNWAEGDVRRLLAAVRLTLDLYARYVTREDYAAIMAALTGKEASGG